jgi:hypothetical protein
LKNKIIDILKAEKTKNMLLKLRNRIRRFIDTVLEYLLALLLAIIFGAMIGIDLKMSMPYTFFP